MKLKPFNNTVIGVVRDDAKISKGGILAPDVAKSALPWRLVDVVAVGPGATNAQGITKPCQSSAGTCVMIPKGVGTIIPLDDVEHLAFADNVVIGEATDIEVETRITALDGKLMKMMPSSIAKPDVGYENQEKTDIARREGWLDDEIDPKTGKDSFVDETA